MSLSRISLIVAILTLGIAPMTGAVSYPSSGPAWSFSGWSFGTYFKNLVNNPCPVWYYVSGFSDGAGTYNNGATEILVPYAGAICTKIISAGWSFGDTLYYSGSSWVATNVIYNNGVNVGIWLGGIVPQAKLEVAGGIKIGYDSAVCSLWKAGTIRANGVDFEYCNWSDWWAIWAWGGAGWWLTGNAGTNSGTNFLGTTDSQPLILRTNNTERFRVSSNGNISWLGASSNITGTNQFAFGTNAWVSMSGSDNAALWWFNAGGVMWGSNNIALWGFNAGVNSSGNFNSSLWWFNAGIQMTGIYNVAVGWLSVGNQMSGNYNTALWGNNAGYIMQGNYNIAIGTAAGTGMTTGNNNIYIGSYAVGNANQDNQFSIGNVIYGSGMGTGGFTNGRVGIGTASPSAKLEVNGTVKITDGTQGAGKVLTSDATGLAFWQTPSSGGSTGWSLTGNSIGSSDFIGSTNAQDIVLRTNNTEKLRILSSTSSTWALLFLSGGDAVINGLTVGRGSGQIFSSTAVGERALLSNTTGVGNTANGYFNLSSNTTGSYNTANGWSALRSNTTGLWNTAIGSQALLNSTTGSWNTAIGWMTLSFNTTGWNNTAIGGSALTANTTGSSNTANGDSALRANTTGSGNIAVGFEALRSTTTVDFQTAVGYQALRSNTTGTSNTAVGYRGLYSNTTGTQNTTIGNLSLFSNTTWINNTAHWFRALYANTTGISNTAVWLGALESNTTGNYNTANGVSALGSNTSWTMNTANGSSTLELNTTWYWNTWDGAFSLRNNTTGLSNVALGNDALYRNSVWSGSTAVGYQSLFNIVTSSSAFPNTALGYQALYGWDSSGTWSTNTAYSNVAIGYKSMYGTVSTPSTARDNVAVGTNSLSKITSGYSNVAIGADALSSSTSWYDNTAIGMSSLSTNTTWVSNTANGVYALYNNITGGFNTANGRAALFSNTTGNSNTANGMQSLFLNTTGYNNTANGSSSLQSNTTWYWNTANGMQSLVSNTTGYYNTADGVLSLQSNTTGTWNTAIWYNANVSLGNLTNATAIGANATAWASNTLILWSGANVGIGTASPSAKLHVQNAGELISVFTNTNASTDPTWNVSIGNGGQFAQGYFTIGVGATPSVATHSLRLTSDGGATFRAYASAPSFRSLINGVGDSQIMGWTNTGGNFNGYLSLGAVHTNTWTTGSDTRIYMGTNTASKVDIRDWSDNVKMTVLQNGNAGIGTSAPTAKLDVNGDVKIGNNLVLSWGSTSSILWHPAWFLSLGLQGGSKLLTINSSGNVWVGPLNPSADFEISDVAEAKLRLNSGNASIWDISTNFGVNNNLVVTPFSGSWNVVFSGTNIGIGTISPWAKLDVNGTATVRGDLTVQGKIIADTLVNRTVTNITISGSLLPDSGAPAVYRDIWTNTLPWNNAYLGGQIKIAWGSPWAGKVLTSDATGLATWGQNGNFGNVFSHGTNFDCNTAPTMAWWNFVQWSANCPNPISSQWYRANISLGSEYPLRGAGGYSLEIAFPRNNQAAAGVWMRNVEGGVISGWTQVWWSVGWSLSGNTATNPTSNFIGTTDAQDLVLRTNNGEKLRILATANTNGQILTLTWGDALINGVTVGRGMGQIQNNTALGYQVLNANTTGVNNTANGAYTLNANTTGDYNTANGASALYSNTTGGYNTANGGSSLGANTTGNSNTANGYAALYSNTTGFSNTANGVSALSSNTTGNNNTANGVSALRYNTTGINNTANGLNALIANNTGNGNTAIGTEALYTATWVSFQTAVGYQALRNNTTGTTNVAYGNQSLFSNSTGSSNVALWNATLYNNNGVGNTAVGSSALYRNSGPGWSIPILNPLRDELSSYNVALWANSLFFSLTWSYNIALWYQALERNISGSWNVAIGTRALQWYNGSYNTAIWHLATTSVANLTNATAIGYLATVSASNSLVLGSGANVGIGTSSPVVPLEVQRVNDGGSIFRIGSQPGLYYFDFSRNNGDGWLYIQGNQSGFNNIILAPTGGNVGIGSSSPWAKLEVAGQVKITGGSPWAGKALISDATGLASWGTPINCTASGVGTNNICYGTLSLQNNTTGSNNVAYGNEALKSNNGGNANVSLGYGSMFYNTTGNSNVGIGVYALNSNTTGTANIGIGSDTLVNANANYNIAMGTSSQKENRSWDSNTAIGAEALRFNFTGSFNSAFGNSAASQMQSTESSFVWGNNAFGAYSLVWWSSTGSLNTGYSNSAFGNRAMYGTVGTPSTGFQNSGFGNASLQTVTSGSNNVGIWYWAGNGLTSGSNNIFIGANIAPVSNTASNQLSIGNWIYGNNGNIGIGVNPVIWHKLEVAWSVYTQGSVMVSGWTIWLPPNAGTNAVLAWWFWWTNVGKLYIGDGSGWQFHITKRLANVDSHLVTFQDDGKVGIGTSTPSEALTVSGNVLANAFLYTSDIRLKKDIASIENADDILTKLQGVRFVWKADGRADIGFIAQEVEKVLPELVHTDSTGMKSVEYGNIIPVLVEGYKSEKSRADVLEKRLESLERRLDQLESSK